jgi:GT2 family glycosyltransferase
MASLPTASIVIPTRGRAGYLDVALRSIAAQAERAGAELIVVDDGSDEDTRRVAERHGAHYHVHARPRGPNAARTTGFDAARGPLLVLVDDDVEAPEGWLASLLEAAASHPDHEVFGGPIRPRLEGGGVRSCGREGPPITFLDLGDADCDAEVVWSANMAIRRSALARIGPFDPTLDIYGDEEEWLRRYRAAGGRVRYVAAAGLDHRRAPADSGLRALVAAAYRRGRHSRRFDARQDRPPRLGHEVAVLAGCGWHIVRRRCANGVVMAAHSAGRLHEALAPQPGPEDADFLAGASGLVAGRRARALALADRLLDVRASATAQPGRVDRAARREPPTRRVLVLGVDMAGPSGLMAAARQELQRSRHEVELAITAGDPDRGKFQNLNALLADHPLDGRDWLLVIDDDVALPRGFLDRFLFLAERYRLALAQPAHRRHSHAAWSVTRRRWGSVVRETAFVEIGPVTAFARETFDALLPFPALRMGWGLDLHWAALARERGWRLGVVDAVPVLHAARPVAAVYSRQAAIAEARAFLEGRPYVPREEAQRTLAAHRSW